MAKHKVPNPYGVKVGELWVGNDPRHPRRLKIIKLVMSKWDEPGYAEMENISSRKISRARLDRFNGRRSGYSKVE